MNKILISAFFLILAGCVAVDLSRPTATESAPAAPAAAAPQELPVPASFDIEMPVLHEPLDQTPITPTETVGASRTE
jgi:hypothetical protein